VSGKALAAGNAVRRSPVASAIPLQPATFRVDGVIPGWTEALQLMHIGDKWRVFVPSELAYGANGAGGVIGPHSVLVFDIELLGIN
jgi:FKBP-type peptidyl-prolyl cis-trans isomerase FklB